MKINTSLETTETTITSKLTIEKDAKIQTIIITINKDDLETYVVENTSYSNKRSSL